MFIFPEALKEDELEKAIKQAREEIEKQGGEVNSITRMGKRSFAQTMQKKEAGHYVVMMFDLEGDKIDMLRARYKLVESVFRVQILRAPTRKTAEASAGTQ